MDKRDKSSVGIVDVHKLCGR